jgi:hypothetical protein
MVRFLAAIWFAACLAVSASASLILTIDLQEREAELGESLLYTGSLTYTGENTIELYGIGFYGPDGFVSDFNPLVGHIKEMAPGDTYTGELFNFRINPGTTYGSHTARIDAVGFDSITNTMVTDSKFVTVNVVPEPASLLVLASALGLFLRRRGRPAGPSGA